MTHLHNFTIDAFTQRRGEPAMLRLSCAQCHEPVLLYQKDGPGPLLRCYWDRIHGPKAMVALHKKTDPPEELQCPNCQTVLGKSGVYEKENRLVFILEEGALRQLIVRSEEELVED